MGLFRRNPGSEVGLLGPWILNQSVCEFSKIEVANMNKGQRARSWALTILILAPLAPAQTYNITDLGTFPGGSVSQAQAISNCGLVAGYARFANSNAHGFLWSKRHGLRDLGAIPPASNFSVAQAINASGDVAGYSDHGEGLNEHAVLWIHGKIHDLGTLPGGTISEAMGMNDRGDITGFSNSALNSPHGFLLRRSNDTRVLGAMQDLGTLSGGSYSQALAINNREQVVGFSNAADGNWRGFLWTKSSGMHSLPYLPGGGNASANGISSRGQIAGGSSFGGCGFCAHAVLWNPDDLGKEEVSVQDLGTLPTAGWSTAFAANDRGQVAGWSGFHAFVWSRGSGMQDLNDMIPRNSGWFLTIATAINMRGQITGEGVINGQQHAFLLTSISEQSDECSGEE